MCEEVSSSSNIATSANKVVPAMEPVVEEFDPVCCFRPNSIESCSQVSLSDETRVSTSIFNASSCQLTAHLQESCSTINLVNRAVEISSTNAITNNQRSPSGSSTPSDFTTAHFCTEDISDSDVDPFSATVVYAGLTALGDLTNVDTIYNEVTNMCGEQDTSIQIHMSEFEPCTSTVCGVPPVQVQSTIITEKKSGISQTKKSRASYKHVPHHEKPVQVVERRNARERRRVQSVNSAFVRLRRALPSHVVTGRGKRVSKVKTLKAAMNYIWTMQQLLKQESHSSAPSS
ncbi:Myc-type basic helix-loop-helix (bHLH) domain [Trinorchestia longiramus]|nr:Myc-type basic helix-loop-helix (bHLH) domain [Trinorchestia longiramus]